MGGRLRLRAEVWIVLGLSLGQSAVYAVVSLTAKLTEGPLRDQTATLNASRSDRAYLDLTYQLLGIGFALVPVVLALYLLSLDRATEPVTRRLGLDTAHPLHDLAVGVGLSALIGLPGLGLYFLGRELGINATVIPSGLDAYWWTIPVLLLAALQNSLVEEIIIVGYFMTRLREAGWSVAATIVTSAAIRGTYHLYQGFGAGLGNFVMGLIFGYWFHKRGRVMPLVVAHTILDIVAFAGYALFAETLGLP